MNSHWRSFGLALHRRFAGQAAVARLYLWAWDQALSLLPEGWLKVHLRNNLLTASWPPFALWPRKVSFVTGQQVTLRPRPGTLSFSGAMFRRRFAHEPEVFCFLNSRMDGYGAVVEVGANVGVFTLFFAKGFERRYGGEKRVFAFEPSRDAFAALSDHLELNRANNVAAFNSAVWPETKRATFFANDKDWMKGSMDMSAAGEFVGGGTRLEQVSTVTDEDIMPMLPAGEHLLVKIDVVGTEATVLNALRNLIADRKPDLLLGVWQYNLESLNNSRLLDNYNLFKIEPEGLVRKERFSDGDYCNYFAEAKVGAG